MTVGRQILLHLDPTGKEDYIPSDRMLREIFDDYWCGLDPGQGIGMYATVCCHFA
jgi:hypothetical protein